MFDNLVASTAVAESSWRSSVLSVVSHTAAFLIAVLATRGAVVATPAAPTVPRVLPYIDRPVAPTVTIRIPGAAAFAAPAALPAVPVIVPVGLPPIGLSAQDRPRVVGRSRLPDHDTFTPLGAPLYPTPSAAIHAQGEVDEPVQRLGGPTPVYPTTLRAAGVEGMVQVRMVVDTLGRVEPGSVLVVYSTNIAFEAAALDAVRAARFSPARVAGAAVRQLVQQSIRFSLEQQE